MSPAAKSARVQSGVPTGGQFAATRHAESAVTLDGDTAPAYAPKLEWKDGYAVARLAPPLPGQGIFTPPTGQVSDYDRAIREQLLDSLRTARRSQGRPFVGSKYAGGHQPAAQIAKSLRQDIREAQATGALPGSVTFSVTSSSFSGGQSVDIEIRNIPDADMFLAAENRGGYVSRESTAEGQDLQRTLKTMMDAYQRDASDTQSDHFDVQFYGQVRVQSEDSADHAVLEREAQRADRELRAARDKGWLAADHAHHLAQIREHFAAQTALLEGRIQNRTQSRERAEDVVGEAISR